LEGTTVYRVLTIVTAIVLGSTGWAGELVVAPLIVREHAGVARRNAPVTGGVPVGPFRVKNVRTLGLFDADGKRVAAQIVPTVKAKDGTLTWVLVDFQTDLKPKEVERFQLRRTTGAPATRRGISCTSRNGFLTVNIRGDRSAVISKTSFDLFDQMLRPATMPHGPGTRPCLRERTGRPAGLVLVDAVSGKTFDSHHGQVHGLALEDSGPERTTVRVDGALGNDRGETYLKYTARLTFWFGSRTVRLLYSIRNTNRQFNTAAKIRRATINLNLRPDPEGMYCVVGAGTPHLSKVHAKGARAEKSSQRHWRVTLEQRGPDRAILSRTHRATFYMGTEFDEMGYRVLQEQPHKPTKRTRYVDCGMRCGGWIDLAGKNGGCLVWVRNFTENPLKRIRADAHGRIQIDLIPEYDGDRQMFYRGGGYWMTDSAHRTYEIWFHFHPKPLITQADRDKLANTFTSYVQTTKPTMKKYNDLVATFARPLIAVSTPAWYTKCYALCGPVPSLEDETRANRLWGRTKDGPVKPYTKERLGVDFLPRENYHWRSESDEPRDCLMTYVRTGDGHYLRRAKSFANVARDMGVFRCDGEKHGKRETKAIWKNKAEQSMTGTGWGSTKMCGCHTYGAGLVDMWLMTGDRSYRDAAVDLAEHHVGGKLAGLARGFSRIGASCLRVAQVTREPRYVDWLKNRLVFPQPSDALRTHGLGVMPGECVGSWMYVIAVYAIHRNLAVHGDIMDPILRDQARDRIIAWARVAAAHQRPGVKPKTKKGYGLCSIYTITAGYELTGDRSLLDAAKKIWSRKHKLGDDTVDARLQDWGPSSGANLYWARYLFENYAHPRSDRQPPDPIKDLKAEPLGGGKVRLTWTAPVDPRRMPEHAQLGGALVQEYQAKHAPLPIVTWDEFYKTYPNDVGKKMSWFGAYNVAGEPKPGRPGLKQSMVVENIPAGTRCFRIRSWDASMNQSALSNEVKVEVR